MALKLDSKIPAGALAEKWSNHKAAIKVVSPANKRKLDIIIVGTGLGGVKIQRKHMQIRGFQML